MYKKRKSPQTISKQTGTKSNGRGTKRKRIAQCQLAFKWKSSNEVLSLNECSLSSSQTHDTQPALQSYMIKSQQLKIND